MSYTENRNAKRAVRLMAVRDALYREPLTVQQLAMQFGVSDDAIRGDLVDLQIPPLSVPLLVDNQGRWYVMDVVYG